MSRLEKERWIMGQERWPNLQEFLSKEIPEALLGNEKELAGKTRAKLFGLEAVAQASLAQECWDFLANFKNRYDDYAFLRDGFGVLGKPPWDNRGKGQMALSRVKQLYAILAEEVRTLEPGWKPLS